MNSVCLGRVAILIITIGLGACGVSPERQSNTQHHRGDTSTNIIAKPSSQLSQQSYRCQNPESYRHQVVGSGYCVALLQRCSRIPLTKLWRQGPKVKGRELLPGTIIATFKNGRYPNVTGYHSASYISQNERGIWVWDQWQGQPVHKRLIRFKSGRGIASNDGDAYSVVIK